MTGDQRGDSLWAWQALEDGEWGLISAVIPKVGHAALVGRDRKVVSELMRPFVEEHVKASGLPVRLARFALAEVAEEIGGPDQ